MIIFFHSLHCLMVTLNHFFLVFQHFLQLISTKLFCERYNTNLLSSYDHISVFFSLQLVRAYTSPKLALTEPNMNLFLSERSCGQNLKRLQLIQKVRERLCNLLLSIPKYLQAFLLLYYGSDCFTLWWARFSKYDAVHTVSIVRKDNIYSLR